VDLSLMLTIKGTVVFPAWKSTLSSAQLMEVTENFENIEHQQASEDGFEVALSRIGGIEATLGLADLDSHRRNRISIS
jgi:hypothetical protein